MKIILLLILLTVSLTAQTRDVVRDKDGKVIATIDRPSRRCDSPAVVRDKQGKVIATQTQQGNTTVTRDKQGRVISNKTKR